jgi:hypothetical protein
VYFTAWPFSKLQVLHWPVARARYIVSQRSVNTCEFGFKELFA